MRIYEPSINRILGEVTVLLTPEELKQLAGHAAFLAEEPSVVHSHVHVDNAELQRELLLAVVTEETVPTFVERLQEILRD